VSNPVQDHIVISEVRDDIALLKDGGAAIILKVSAVNFGLLSSEEQMAIIGSFAQMLNSLSFAIQIVIISKRLDISSYIKLLDKELSLQTNPLLSETMVKYRQFVQSLIRENEVLDKSFYIAIPVSRLELSIGILKGDELLKKAQTKLLPRRDQIARQLNRVGLKITQLDSKQILEIFYYIYNPADENAKKVAPKQINLNTPQKLAPVQTAPIQTPQAPPTPLPTQPVQQPPQPPPSSARQYQPPRNHPFVVEELSDSI